MIISGVDLRKSAPVASYYRLKKMNEEAAGWIVSGGVVASVTILAYAKVLPSENYVNIILMLMAYHYGKSTGKAKSKQSE